MRQPRATRKKTIVVLSSSDHDEADDSTPQSPIRASVASKSKPKASSIQSQASPFPNTSSTQETTTSSQSQTRAPKAKSKDAPKPRRKEKPIYSFFNAATQRQQSQNSETAENAVTQVTEDEREDLIQDDSLDEELVHALDNAVNHRPSKRTRNILGVSEEGPPGGSQKFLKISAGQKIPASIPETSAAKENDQRSWVEKYAPVDLEELAVHKRKVADVRTWLASVLEGRENKRLLVLKGAAGTAKTTTVNLLSQDLGFDIVEWKNPTGSEYSSEGFVPLSTQFEDFMGRGKFGSLDFGEPQGTEGVSYNNYASKQVILIEEFPNTFTRSSSALQSFRSSVLQYLSSVPSLATMFSHSAEPIPSVAPIVMVISETLLSTNTAAADSFTAHRLLGPDIVNHPSTTVIEFNAIAPTILTKALELVVAKEARKSGRKTTPGPQVIKKLSEVGDVRSAVSALEFLCVRGDNSAGWGSRVTFRSSKRGAREKPLTKMEQESLAMIMQRENTLGIFHAVGKVVHNKREESTSELVLPQPPFHLPQHRRSKPSEVQIDALLDELGTDIQTFVAALHENYILSCNTASEEDTLDSINGCIDALSDADLLSPDRFSTVGLTKWAYQGTGTDSLRQDEMSFQVSVRGLLFNLPYPVRRSLAPPDGKGGRLSASARADAYRISYPTSAKLWRHQEEVEGFLDLLLRNAQIGYLSGSHDHTSARPSKCRGVETWSTGFRSIGPEQINANKSETNVAPVLGSSGMAKREMLLERLPFMALMLQRKCSRPNIANMKLHDIEKIVSFHGFNIDTKDGLAEEDVGGRVEGQQRSTERPVDQGEFTFLQTTTGQDEAGNVGSGEQSLANLVPSDDDIEDD